MCRGRKKRPCEPSEGLFSSVPSESLARHQNLGNREQVNEHLSCAEAFQIQYLTSTSWQFPNEMCKELISQ